MSIKQHLEISYFSSDFVVRSFLLSFFNHEALEMVSLAPRHVFQMLTRTNVPGLIHVHPLYPTPPPNVVALEHALVKQKLTFHGLRKHQPPRHL